MQRAVGTWNTAWRTWIALNATELAWTVLIVGGVFSAALLGGR